ncbi:MAG: hypothetical protein JEZ14_09325 [Marinilabiliaceae bacterium]|nr:hypothetical protein [Marinilabiliaceae bacterium]
MFKFGIIGYGDLGIQIGNFLLEKGYKKEDICVFDDIAFKNKIPNSYSFSAYKQDLFAHLSFYLGLGYHNLLTKSKILSNLLSLKRKVPALIHYTAYVHPTSIIEEGVIIYPQSCICQEVTIRQGTLINNSVTISHNSTIGASCFIAPGAVICGNTNIGSLCFIGAGVNISNGINIGKNCKLSIGTTLTKDMPDNHSLINIKSQLTNKQLKLI